MNNLIAVTIGDIKGIGIEILLKTWQSKKIKNFILFTNEKYFRYYLKKNNIKIKYKVINNISIKLLNLYKNKFLIYTYNAINNPDNTYKSLKYAYEFTKLKKSIGIITLPLNKNIIIKNIDKKFQGQTEFFQKLDNKKYSNMIFIHQKIIIATLTNHIRLKSVTNEIKKTEKILNKIRILNNTLIFKFNLKKPKLIISGINPHCSEEGNFGNEEKKYQIPIIKKLIREGIDITGPISGDSIINDINILKYDCFIFNYHDQALIPFKIISKYSGINFTDGLSILRVSPDHGTAYDIVGKNIANNSSLINCYKFLTNIIKNDTNK